MSATSVDSGGARDDDHGRKSLRTLPEPHPYALMLPPLTDDEYAGLKADIEANGILYPVILDEDGRILDGVHRVRIATELGIDPPVSHLGHLDDDRKLHLAVGLNMRRRHLDADRRRELVRRLHDDEELSLRKIADITGWSKSTVDRDLKTSPFEEVISAASGTATVLHEHAKGAPSEQGREILSAMGGGFDAIAQIHAWADQEWKRGNWPPDPVEHATMTLELHTVTRQSNILVAAISGQPLPPEVGDWRPVWDDFTVERREGWAEKWRIMGILVGHNLSHMGQPEDASDG